MEGIYNATSDFPFDKLVLLKPTVIAGGNYFIKFKMNDLPVYIQTPKCTTKHGILKAGKRYFSDLMFNNENESFIQWMEKLEEYSQTYIYNNREAWFDTELELHDIENSFSSCIKLYKSGKYYILRTHVPTQLGKCTLKIYNENEELVEPDDVNDKNDIITILEIQGIKCSARSFQIEIEIKQMLIMRQNNLFEKCILASGKSKLNNTISTSANIGTLDQETTEEFSRMNETKNNTKFPEYLGNSISTNKVSKLSRTFSNTEESHSFDSNSTEVVDTDDSMPQEETEISETKPETEIEKEPEETNELKEVEFHLDSIPENNQIYIKTRNDVYYKMYQDAKRKAKLAKDLALSAYLEAKRIKNTYMIEDADDSDSELDENSDVEK